MRLPIKKARLLKNLDDAEVIKGYVDGTNNEPEPHGNRSYSYWHGWRNGMVDGGHMKADDAQAELAHDYLKVQRKRQND